ncbi:metalloregulator ArsR/SmtB family transcription factor [Paenibacillus hodogayensis]|uniref:Metalloregulator ArsR/SmtB family transcription factor n=1 Tax=Paenibacillus hodogayensis TaxID=279208 RepID=A0ABV5W4T7_9BACL
MNARTDEARQPSTRRDILILLKINGLLTVQDMADRLGLTGMAVRRHLLALQKERYVRLKFERRKARKPVAVYRLSDAAEELFPNQYDGLTLELLDSIRDTFGETFLDELFAKRTEKLRNEFRSVQTGCRLEERLTALARIQDDLGYMVKLEKAGKGIYILEEANCPVSRVASRYRQVCQCELELFAELLDADVKRMECMADGGAACRYLVCEKRVNA